METIRNYLESMFSQLPNTPEVLKAKYELGQMMELLRFGGVPHYVTISPDGQIMRNSLNYFSNNYDLFLQRLDEMKVRLSGSNETKNY